MASKEIEEKVLDYIAEHSGLVTKNDVVTYIEKKLSKPTTLELLNKLEKEKKINVLRGDRRGQPHYLSINDKNQFNQIKQQLSRTENFIKEVNQYLQRRNVDNIYDIPLKEYEDPDKEIKLDNRIDFVNKLYYYYYDIFRRILDDLFHITATSNLSKEDSERFLKKIIELRSKLKYLPWSKENEKKQLKTDISNIKRLIRRFERDGLEDYIKEKWIKSKFAEPSVQEINHFIDQFLA